jgi:phosphatidylglycerophosphate synthase
MLGGLRKAVRRALRPFSGVVRQLGIHPNVVTTAGIAFSVLAAYLLMVKDPLLSAICITVSGVLDVLDGFYARTLHLRSRFGGTLDATSDRYGEFLIAMGASIGGYVSWELTAFAIFSMLVPSYVRARAESTGGMRNCSVGIIERPEKLLLLAGASVLVVYDLNALTYAFIIISVLGQVTAVQRLWATWEYSQRIHLLHNREVGGETR